VSVVPQDAAAICHVSWSSSSIRLILPQLLGRLQSCSPITALRSFHHFRKCFRIAATSTNMGVWTRGENHEDGTVEEISTHDRPYASGDMALSETGSLAFHGIMIFPCQHHNRRSNFSSVASMLVSLKGLGDMTIRNSSSS
jgi:hypothetical protein